TRPQDPRGGEPSQPPCPGGKRAGRIRVGNPPHEIVAHGARLIGAGDHGRRDLQRSPAAGAGEDVPEDSTRVGKYSFETAVTRGDTARGGRRVQRDYWRHRRLVDS